MPFLGSTTTSRASSKFEVEKQRASRPGEECKTTIRNNQRDGVELDKSGAVGVGRQEGRGEERDDDDGEPEEEEEEEDANEDPNYRERMRLKRFSSSALCLNDDKSQRGQRQHHKCYQQHESHRKDKHLAINDGQQQCCDSPKRQILGSKIKSKLNQDNNRSARKQQQQRESNATNLLPPDDPIVQLARQRRPSVGNQGSVNVDQQALFSAVECNQLERAKTILDNGKVNVNSLNGDKLTCLDVAVLLRNTEMAKLLQRYQAKESSAFLTREGRENQLYALYMEARRLVEDLSHSIEAILPSAGGRQSDCTAPAADSHQQLQSKSSLSSSAFSSSANEQQQQLSKGSLLSAALIEEKQRQLQYWRRRLDLFMQMRYSFDKLDIPKAPELVVLQVVGENSLGVKIVHSLDSFNQLLHHNSNKPQRPAKGRDSNCHEPLLEEQRAVGGGGGELPPRASLNELANLVRERNVVCSMGLKCSHWLMDEYLALKRTDQILNASSTMNSWLVGQAGQRRHSRMSTATTDSGTSCSQQQQQQQQVRLAVFNYLLAQQLAHLSSEQRQQQERELYEHNSYFRLKKWAQMRMKQRQQQAEEEEEDLVGQQQQQSGGLSRADDAPSGPLEGNEQVPPPPGASVPTRAERLSLHQNQLMCSHQTESTDSAYDHIAAAASRQQLQQQLSMLAIHPAAYAAPLLHLSQPKPTGEASNRLALSGAPMGAAKHSEESLAMMSCVQSQPGPFQQAIVPYHSLAYQLMSARRHNNDFCEEASAPRSQQQQQHQHSAKKSCNCCSGPCAAVAATAATAVAAAIASNPIVSDSSGANNMIVVTKYKIEWSLNEHFEPVVDSMIIYNTNSYPIECHINNLTNGQLYFVRVSSGNQKGFSEARCTTPACLAPSSWRQVALLEQADSTASATAAATASAAASASSSPSTTGASSTSCSRNRASSFKKSTATATASWSSSSSSSTKRKLKYDEKVFRKFTKLILLNKHILDANQVNQLQREQHLMAMDKNYRPDRGLAGSKLGASLQNKSSLINMLLLDATMPATGSSASRGSSSNQGGELDLAWNSGSGGAGASLGQSGNCLTITGHSPRGSLYPIESNNASLLGSSASNQDADQQDQLQQQQQTSSLKVKKNFKNFFQSNSAKFHKLNNQNKRGLYLATVIYSSNNTAQSSTSPNKSTNAASAKQQQQQATQFGGMEANKIVVTNDDRLPIIEIMNDLVSPSALMGDFYWLLKINGTKWIDIKRLRQQLQKSHSSSTLYLRIKLLNAIEQMQLALNLEDIGRLFYKPIQAHDGSIVICTCKHVSSVKLVSNLSIKWANQNKLMPRHLRKISDTIARQTNQELQQQQQQQQQHFLQCNFGGPAIGKRNASTVSMPTASHHHQSQEASPQSVLAMPAAAQSGCGSGPGATPQPTAAAAAATNLVASSNVNSGASAGLASSDHSSPAGGKSAQVVHNQQQQQQNGSQHLLSASNAQLPAELAGRLCESCQLTLSQRRCTMTSGSSSSSLASNESQSTWSSSQFSLSSRQQAQAPPPQQQQQTARSCTCSRSNSASIISQHQARTSQASGGNLGNSQPTTTSASTCPPGSHSLQAAQSVAVSVSAPGSQRNSASARSSSSSFLTTLQSQQSGHQQQQQQQQQASMLATTGGSSSSLYTGHSHSQQLGSSSAPQKSSTYLMLASLNLYDLLLFHLSQIIEFDQTSTEPLKRGLYLGFVQLQTTVESMRLLVPRKRPNMIPCTRIRDNAHVSREEWHLLKQFGHLFGGADKRRQQQQQQQQRQQAASAAALAPTKSSSRSSDPAIWSGANRSSAPGPQVKLAAGNAETSDSAIKEQQQQQLGGGSGQSLLLSATNCPISLDARGRAKSVSPGLMTMGTICASGGETATTTAPLLDSISEAKLMAASLKNQLGSAPSNDSDNSSKQASPQLVDQQQQQQLHSFSVTDLKSDLVVELAQGEQNHSDSNLYKLNALQPVATTDCQPLTGAGTAKIETDIGQQPAAGKTTFDRQLSAAHSYQSPEMTFVRLIGDAAKRLLCELKSQLPKVYDFGQDTWMSVLASLNDEENNRVYHIELIELSNQVTFVLLIPAPENVCPVTSHEKSTMLTNNNNSEYMLLPLQIFETIHLNTYEPDLLGKYSRLSTILETDLIVAQHEHRQAFSSSELKSTKSRVSHLQDMVSIADEFWRQLRWIVDVVSFARDKSHYNNITSSDLTASGSSQTLAQSQSSGCIRVGTIWRHFDNLSTSSSSRWRRGATMATKTIDELLLGRDEQAELSEKQQREQGQAKTGRDVDSNDKDDNNNNNNKPEIKRTLSAQRRDRKQNPSALNNSSSKSTTNQHYSSSITTMNCLDQQQQLQLQLQQQQHQRQKPPRLPRIQLPSGEQSGDDDGDEMETSSGLVVEEASKADSEGAARRRKDSRKAGRHSSAGPTGLKKEPRPSSEVDDPVGSGARTTMAYDRRYSQAEHGASSVASMRHRLSDGQCQGAVDYHASLSEQQRKRQQQHWPSDSGEDCSTLTDTTFERNSADNIGEQVDDGDGQDACYCFEERVFNVDFGSGMQVDDENNGPERNMERDHDEEAIYAYHLSLRDATKAAAQRKSSQQSVNVFLVEGEERARCPSIVSTPFSELDPGQSSSGQVEFRVGEGDKENVNYGVSGDSNSNDETAMIALDLAEGDSEHLTTNIVAFRFRPTQGTNNQSCTIKSAEVSGSNYGGTQHDQSVEPLDLIESKTFDNMQDDSESSSAGRDTKSRRETHLKSTNPFLTDSFEL